MYNRIGVRKGHFETSHAGFGKAEGRRRMTCHSDKNLLKMRDFFYVPTLVRDAVALPVVCYSIVFYLFVGI